MTVQPLNLSHWWLGGWQPHAMHTSWRDAERLTRQELYCKFLAVRDELKTFLVWEFSGRSINKTAWQYVLTLLDTSKCIYIIRKHNAEKCLVLEMYAATKKTICTALKHSCSGWPMTVYKFTHSNQIPLKLGCS